jgi:hypothetical protein
MTPDELDRALWASFKLRESELRDDMRNSWYVAHLMRQHRLPPLLLWLGPPKYDADELARRKAEHEQMIKEIG